MPGENHSLSLQVTGNLHGICETLGPALMAVWSKALPLTASCLSPLPGLACEKVASDLWLGGGFLWVLCFLPPVTTGLSRRDEKRNSKS